MSEYEIDELVELVELVETAASDELLAFGCIEFEPQFDWSRKALPDERGWSVAACDIVRFEGASNAEALFELF